MFNQIGGKKTLKIGVQVNSFTQGTHIGLPTMVKASFQGVQVGFANYFSNNNSPQNIFGGNIDVLTTNAPSTVNIIGMDTTINGAASTVFNPNMINILMGCQLNVTDQSLWLGSTSSTIATNLNNNSILLAHGVGQYKCAIPLSYSSLTHPLDMVSSYNPMYYVANVPGTCAVTTYGFSNTGNRYESDIPSGDVAVGFSNAITITPSLSGIANTVTCDSIIGFNNSVYVESTSSTVFGNTRTVVGFSNTVNHYLDGCILIGNGITTTTSNVSKGVVLGSGSHVTQDEIMIGTSNTTVKFLVGSNKGTITHNMVTSDPISTPTCKLNKLVFNTDPSNHWVLNSIEHDLRFTNTNTGTIVDMRSQLDTTSISFTGIHKCKSHLSDLQIGDVAYMTGKTSTISGDVLEMIPNITSSGDDIHSIGIIVGGPYNHCNQFTTFGSIENRGLVEVDLKGFWYDVASSGDCCANVIGEVKPGDLLIPYAGKLIKSVSKRVSADVIAKSISHGINEKVGVILLI